MVKKDEKKKEKKPAKEFEAQVVSTETSLEALTGENAEVVTETAEAESPPKEEEMSPKEEAPKPEKTPKLKKGMVRVKVLANTLEWEEGVFHKGDIFETTKKRANRFDRTSVQIL